MMQLIGTDIIINTIISSISRPVYLWQPERGTCISSQCYYLLSQYNNRLARVFQVFLLTLTNSPEEVMKSVICPLVKWKYGLINLPKRQLCCLKHSTGICFTSFRSGHKNMMECEYVRPKCLQNEVSRQVAYSIRFLSFTVRFFFIWFNQKWIETGINNL